MLELEHKVPRAKGGGYEIENLGAARHTCNRGKKDIFTDDQWVGELITLAKAVQRKYPDRFKE